MDGEDDKSGKCVVAETETRKAGADKRRKRNTKKGTRKGTFNMSTHIESGRMKRPDRQPLTSSKIKQDYDGRLGQCS